MFINQKIKFPRIEFGAVDPLEFLKNTLAKAVYACSVDAKIDKLKEWYNRGSLTIVFGAGPSMECGLPSWNSLISKFLVNNYSKSKDGRTLASDIFTEIFPINSLILARMISYEAEINCNEVLKKILYEDENIENGKIYDSASRLYLNRDTIKKINSVITYNYDDIFERKIRQLSGRRIIHKSIYGNYIQEYRSLLPIFHVHGFIPKNETESMSCPIVFSEDSYHAQYSNTYNWNNLTQIEKFRDTNCIFIGTSFSDPNMRRLLDISVQQCGRSSPRHMVVKKKHDYESIKQRFQFEFEINSELFTEHDIIKSLICIAEDLETADALSFNIKTIWVDSYDEIPRILEKIL